MIVVLCANPAVDVTYQVDRLRPGQVHAPTTVVRRAGGKGTNVARVCRQLGADVRLVAPTGGAAGAAFVAELDEAGLPLSAVGISESTRTSVALVDDRDATVVNEAGPWVRSYEWREITRTLDAVLAPGDVLVLSGSLPPGVADTAYADLVATHADVTTVVDTKGPALVAAARANPTIAAPNALEVRAALGDESLTAAAGAEALRRLGARTAVVSDGADGLVAAGPDGLWSAAPPRVVTGNPTGAGDALTAALAVALATGADVEALLRSAVATSAAAVATPVAGLIDTDLRAEFVGRVRVVPAGRVA